MNMVQIHEVGTRDGFQSVKTFIPTEQKKRIISSLHDAGISCIQATSFVSPKAVPQMADAAEIAMWCLKEYPDMQVSALVPNKRGAQNAFDVGIRNISFIISVSESHNQANTRRSREAALDELKIILEEMPELSVCADVVTATGCPFEGKFAPEKTIEFMQKEYDIGIRHFCLCDTIGIGDPEQIRTLVKGAKELFSDAELEVHIHDTRNMGMVNTLAAIEAGVTKVQSAVSGLGGCPFAPGATGNLATEDLVYMLLEMQYNVGIDFEKLLTVAKEIYREIDGNFSGHHIRIEKNHICV